MTQLGNIRGRAPNKTERILEYLISKPDEILKPKDIADALGFNLQTTVTVLTRLTLEGSIVKVERGKYRYINDGGTLGVEGSAVVQESYPQGGGMDSNTASQIYKAIYNLVSEVVGSAVVENLTGLKLDDFDEEKPAQFIRELILTLIKVLGNELTGDIVNVAMNEIGHGFKLEDIMETAITS